MAIPLPKAAAAERRRKANVDRDQRCKPNARSLPLLGWALFLTHVPPEVCAARSGAELYGRTWRMEIIFEAWKSHFRLTEVPAGSQIQWLAVGYARLLFITRLAQVASGSGLARRAGHPAPPGSLLKLAALSGDDFATLCFETWNIHLGEALRVQLDHHGRYARRTRENFVAKLMNLS